MQEKIRRIIITIAIIIAIAIKFLSGSDNSEITNTFRNDELLTEHFEKHGSEMGCDDPHDYLQKANNVINNPNALHKLEKEDGDDVYYLEETNELVIVSTDGYIRTYFLPDDGKKFYDKQ